MPTREFENGGNLKTLHWLAILLFSRRRCGTEHLPAVQHIRLPSTGVIIYLQGAYQGMVPSLITFEQFLATTGSSEVNDQFAPFIDRVRPIMLQLREHITDALASGIGPCRPLWFIYQLVVSVTCDGNFLNLLVS